MKTWKAEAMVVATVLFIQLCVTGFHLSEAVCAVAVYVTFLHAQVADRMQERQAKMSVPDVECHHKLGKYFIIKECLWVSFFLMTRSYAALMGAGVFLAYPLWRRCWRKINPLK